MRFLASEASVRFLASSQEMFFSRDFYMPRVSVFS